MKVNKKEFVSVWMQGTKVKMINQLMLPFNFRISNSNNWTETATAISNMAVRGAGTIGAAAAFGMAQSILLSNEKNYQKDAQTAALGIKKTRPTANDLFFAVNHVLDEIKKSNSLKEAKIKAKKKAKEIFELYLFSGKKIAQFGQPLIKKNSKILTHCNAGWLALVDWGSATAPIYLAKRKGKNPFVFVDETRPRGQGRLTSWELSQEKVKHALIADNAAGHFMQKGEIDLVITGADRIALNGDVANKIGTYEKAVLAKENGIPFYVAAPQSTFDLSIKTGKEIIIEHRNADELLLVEGTIKGKKNIVKIVSGNPKVINPAFDVTPSKYIDGIITPKGIIKANKKEIQKAFT